LSMRCTLTSPDWPPLPFSEWEGTCDTLHMWTQIVGKTRLALTPLENHWWNVPLYVTPRGLSTSPIPIRRETFEVEFDFLAHKLSVRTSRGEERSLDLFPRSVADFYAEYMAVLRSLGIEVKIRAIPDEFDDNTPFDKDQHHASYDAAHVENFRRILVNVDRIFKEFRSRFLGKCSPVHFFWGSFDLAVTRFSGRRAQLAPNADRITREAYSHEVISCGFWPGAPTPLAGILNLENISLNTTSRAPPRRPARRFSTSARAPTRRARISRRGTALRSSAILSACKPGGPATREGGRCNVLNSAGDRPRLAPFSLDNPQGCL
jgi:hypothetical protein